MTTLTNLTISLLCRGKTWDSGFKFDLARVWWLWCNPLAGMDYFLTMMNENLGSDTNSATKAERQSFSQW